MIDIYKGLKNAYEVERLILKRAIDAAQDQGIHTIPADWAHAYSVSLARARALAVLLDEYKNDTRANGYDNLRWLAHYAQNDLDKLVEGYKCVA